MAVIVDNRYEILEKEEVGKCLSNGEKVKCYKYTYKDLRTGEIETGYGDKDYNEVVRRLGFNPTSRNWDIESKLAKIA